MRWAGMLWINTGSFFYLELTDKTGPTNPANTNRHSFTLDGTNLIGVIMEFI